MHHLQDVSREAHSVSNYSLEQSNGDKKPEGFYLCEISELDFML